MKLPGCGADFSGLALGVTVVLVQRVRMHGCTTVLSGGRTIGRKSILQWIVAHRHCVTRSSAGTSMSFALIRKPSLLSFLCVGRTRESFACDVVASSGKPLASVAAMGMRMCRARSDEGKLPISCADLRKVAWTDDAEGMFTAFMPMLFPMYVMPVSEFLRITEAKPHQVLKEEGLVMEFLASQTGVFVSHQWCGRMHADPGFEQLRVLQGVLTRASDGRVKVVADFFSAVHFSSKSGFRPANFRGAASWVMWHDYFSVPQPGAPQAESTQHADLAKGHLLDYTTWKTRGWCRFERLSRSLSTHNGAMLLVTRSDTLMELGWQDYLMEPVGRGGFSVEGDKASLSPIVQRHLASKLRRISSAHQYEDCRHMISWCVSLLEGLPGASVEGVVPQAFKRLSASSMGTEAGRMDMVWSSKDRARRLCPQRRGVCARWQGVCPYLVAAGLGDVHMLHSLIDGRADIGQAAARDRPVVFYQAGQRAIHIAALHGHTAAITALLDLRASVMALDRRALAPLTLSAFSGSVAAAQALLHRRARIDAECRLGLRTLDYAAMFGRPRVVELLLASGAGFAANAEGNSPLHSAALFRCGAEVVRRLVEARASLEEQLRPKFGGALWSLSTTWSLMYRCGSRSFFSRFGHHAAGAIPLIFALMFDNCAEASGLVWGSAPGTSNWRCPQVRSELRLESHEMAPRSSTKRNHHGAAQCPNRPLQCATQLRGQRPPRVQ